MGVYVHGIDMTGLRSNTHLIRPISRGLKGLDANKSSQRAASFILFYFIILFYYYFCFKKRDWVWYTQFRNLVGWAGDAGTRRMCYICLATLGGPLSCLDSSLGAEWRGTLGMSHAEYMLALRARGYVSEIFNLPGFQYTMLVLDLMHIACLGILQYLLGNVLLGLFFRLDGTIGDPGEAVGRLLTFSKLAAKNQGIETSVFRLTINMIKRPSKNHASKGKLPKHAECCIASLGFSKTF